MSSNKRVTVKDVVNSERYKKQLQDDLDNAKEIGDVVVGKEIGDVIDALVEEEKEENKKPAITAEQIAIERKRKNDIRAAAFALRVDANEAKLKNDAEVKKEIEKEIEKEVEKEVETEGKDNELL